MTKRLGKGLADLIETAPNNAANFVLLRTEQIRPGRFQPRKSLNEPKLEELKTSIRRSGIIEPIVVRPIAHGMYELVAGQRRLKASQALGIHEVPAVVKTLSDREALEHSIVENVQREELNPLEEAQGYATLLNDFGHTQEDIATAVGKDRATVANLLRVLALPEEIRRGLGDGAMTLGHAKALLGIEDRAKQLALYARVKDEGLSVRQTEALARSLAPAKRRKAQRSADPQTVGLEDALRRALGTKVRLLPRNTGGRILIDYFSSEDLTRILGLFGLST